MTPQELLTSLQAVQARAENPTPVLKAIGDLMIRSTEQNFRAEGRPDRWQEVKKATRRRKTARGKSKILTWSGNLARSGVAQVAEKKVVIGSNALYARIHQEGGIIQHYARSTWATARRTDEAGKGRFARTKGKRPHKSAMHEVFTIGAYASTMPARPYLLFQPGEAETFAAMVSLFILTGRIQEGA